MLMFNQHLRNTINVKNHLNNSTKNINLRVILAKKNINKFIIINM